MASSLLSKVIDRMTPASSRRPSETATDANAFITAPIDKLFPKTNPAIDGDDCLHDCTSCTTRLPPKFIIDEEEELYGHVNAFSTHLIVATGKTDWVRDVTDEVGSIMEAIGKAQAPSNGTLMLSASNMPTHDSHSSTPMGSPVLLLPSFTYIDNVHASTAASLLDFISAGPTTSTPLRHSLSLPALPSPFALRPCPHKYLILLCSQKTRDARCGQSAPLLQREFERHLRPLGLYRDHYDERAGGCGIYFISHVGGHKFSANVFVYRRGDAAGVLGATEGGSAAVEVAQCVWLARVRPEDCENIVRYTVLQGKVVKPERQLRGGFDRARQVASW